MGTLVPRDLSLLSPGNTSRYCAAIPGGLSFIQLTSGFRRTYLSALNAKPSCAATTWPFRLAIAPYARNAPDSPASHVSIPRRHVRRFTVWALTSSRPYASSACPWILSRAKTKRPTGIQPYSLSDRRMITHGEPASRVLYSRKCRLLCRIPDGCDVIDRSRRTILDDSTRPGDGSERETT